MGLSESSKLVVGFDGSPSSIEALKWALNESSSRDIEIEVVYAWSLPGSIYPFPIEIPNSAELYDQAKTFISNQVSELAKPYKNTKVILKIVEGAAGTELVKHSNSAGGLVVGAKSHDTLSRLLIGSVSHYVIAHANCPVTIVKSHTNGKE